VFGLLALEIGLRVYKGEWEYTNFRWGDIDFPVKYDSELGWVPKQEPHPDRWQTPATILDDGTRSNGGEIEDAGDPILAVGDSLTFGLGVSDRQTWPAQLEKLAGRRIINGGVSGYGIDQAFLRAGRLLQQHRVSTLILSFIPDDIRRVRASVVWRTPKPYYDVDAGQLFLKNIPVPLPHYRQAASAPLMLLEHSQLVHSVMATLAPDWWLPPGPREQYVHEEEKGMAIACALLHEFERLAAEHDARLVILVEHRVGETASELAASRSVLSCLSAGATVLDLKSALSELRAADPARYRRLYLPNGGHMAAEGNQLVAVELFNLLPQRENGVLQGSSFPERPQLKEHPPGGHRSGP
jgi:hypothetical protein